MKELVQGKKGHLAFEGEIICWISQLKVSFKNYFFKVTIDHLISFLKCNLQDEFDECFKVKLHY